MSPSVPLYGYLVLGAILFTCGVVCMATKRNAIGVLIGVELVHNGANINFVAFSRYNANFEVEGMIFALFVIVMAAGEAAVALAIVLNFYQQPRHRGRGQRGRVERVAGRWKPRAELLRTWDKSQGLPSRTGKGSRCPHWSINRDCCS